MPFVHELAKWISMFDTAGVTPTAQNEAKLHLLDSMGCAFAALGEPTAMGTLRAAQALGGVPECTVIGTPDRTSVANAVLVNGVLVRTLDLNDIPHCSDHIPVALAVGERQGLSGRDVLAAIVLGYEIQCLIPSRGSAGPWDSTSQSSIVAAAMAGWLLQLPVETLANALALSVAHSGTLRIVRRGQLSSAKSVASSMVARMAMVSTLMAAEGVTGPPTALEEWADAVRGGADLSPIIAPREGDFRILGVAIKAFPAVGTSQTAIAAALQAERRSRTRTRSREWKCTWPTSPPSGPRLWMPLSVATPPPERRPTTPSHSSPPWPCGTASSACASTRASVGSTLLSAPLWSG